VGFNNTFHWFRLAWFFFESQAKALTNPFVKKCPNICEKTVKNRYSEGQGTQKRHQPGHAHTRRRYNKYNKTRQPQTQTNVEPITLN
jgi:hypothetical protein